MIHKERDPATPERKLWAMVFINAIRDIKAPVTDGIKDKEEREATRARIRSEARAWFKAAGKDFHDICAILGLEPEWARSMVLNNKLWETMNDKCLRVEIFGRKPKGKHWINHQERCQKIADICAEKPGGATLNHIADTLGLHPERARHYIQDARETHNLGRRHGYPPKWYVKGSLNSWDPDTIADRIEARGHA